MPFGAGGAEEHLLRGAHGRVGQGNLGSVQALGRGNMDAAGPLLHHGAELAQHIKVVVDGAVADLAAAQVRDECFADGVDQGPAEQDGNPGVAGVGVNRGAGRSLGGFRVQGEVPVDGVLLDCHAVELQEGGDYLHVLDLRHVPQHGRFVAQQRCHHRLGNEVFRSADGDAACQRDAAADCQNTTHIPVSSR
jgi:hypothetical protein